MDKQTKKERSERAKRLIDKSLSTGNRFSNIDLYKILESEFNLLNSENPDSDETCMNASELNERNYRLNLEYGSLLKETIRWLKQQITNQGKQVSDYLEIEVYPQDRRRSLYRYKNKGYTIYGNSISANFFSKMDAVIRAMKEENVWSQSHCCDNNYSDTIPDPVSLSNIGHSIQDKIDEMLKLKKLQLHNVFFENLKYFLFRLDENLNNEMFHSKLKIALDEGRVLFGSKEPISMLTLFLSIKCLSYTNEERINFSIEWFKIADFYDDGSYEWLFMCLDITKTIVKLMSDEKDAKECIERCISIIEPLDRLDDDLAEIYSNLCALYTISYIKVNQDEKNAVHFGEKFLRWVKTRRVSGNPSIANVLYFMSVCYASSSFGYDDIKAEFYIKQAIAIMEDLKPSLPRDKEQLSNCYLHLADIYSHYSLFLTHPNVFSDPNCRIITDSCKVSAENIRLLRRKAQESLI